MELEEEDEDELGTGQPVTSRLRVPATTPIATAAPPATATQNHLFFSKEAAPAAGGGNGGGKGTPTSVSSWDC